MKNASDKDLDKVTPLRIKEKIYNLTVVVKESPGEPLRVPHDNIVRSGYFDQIVINQKKDDPILDNNQKPLVGTGLLFYHQDKWKGIPTDGTHIMAFSNVYPDRINDLTSKFASLHALGSTSTDELKMLIENLPYSKMSVHETQTTPEMASIVKKDHALGEHISISLIQETLPVWFVPGPCVFQAAGSNSEYIPAEGAFIVKKETNPSTTQVYSQESLQATFVGEDGSPISVDNIPTVSHNNLIPMLMHAALVTELLHRNESALKLSSEELRKLVMHLNYPGRNDVTRTKDSVGPALQQVCNFLHESTPSM